MGLVKKRRTQKTPDAADAVEKQNLQPGTQVIDFAKRCKDEIGIKHLKWVKRFTWLSFWLYITDVGYDIYLLFVFDIKDWYFWCTFSFLSIPAIVMIVRSFLFYNKEWINKKMNKNGKMRVPRDFLPEESNFSWTMKWVFSFVCPIPRYIDVIKYVNQAIQAKKTDEDAKNMYFPALIWEDAELIQLRQFDSFMESAPQLLLSIHITLKEGSRFGRLKMILTIFSAFFSIISLSCALVSYDQKICLMKGIKRNDENQQNESNGMVIDYETNAAINCIKDINWINIAVLFSANFCFIVARLIALSLFASVYGWIIWSVCLAHLIPIFVWHWSENNYSFMDSLRLSFLHIFAYLYPIENESDKRKHPRFSPVMYQSVCLCENVLLMILWSQSFAKGDVLNLAISSVLSYPWNEWKFFVPLIAQFITTIFSFVLFWLLNQVRHYWYYLKKQIYCVKTNKYRSTLIALKKEF